jgi:hypothetical protein
MGNKHNIIYTCTHRSGQKGTLNNKEIGNGRERGRERAMLIKHNGN